MTFNTVIFDFGGVITSSPFEAFNRMEAERGLPKDFVRRVNSINPDNNAWAKFERAECSATEFDALFAAEAQALTTDILLREIAATSPLSVVMAEQISQLRRWAEDRTIPA